MKKIIALALCFCLLGVPAFAAGNLSVSVSAPSVVQCGQEIELVYTFSSIPSGGICGADFEIGFDEDKVEFVSVALNGFPAEANWQAAGRVSGGKYLLHIFDEYEGAEPVSIYSGTAATVTVKFRALDKSVGAASFTLSSFGSVMGCSFANGMTNTFYGLGSDASVWIYGSVADCVEQSYYVKDGVFYVLPGLTAGELLPTAVSVSDTNGAGKSLDAPLENGDTVDFGTGYRQSSVCVLGDVNSDGRLTTNDYLLLKKYIKDNAGYNISFDFNMDGLVSTADTLCMAKLLRGELFVLS